ncbi:MAG: hypothetical protein JW697_01120 [Kosmotogaceae bacterium]|nr:hypothetical protein [Kosmotogaceae bacterium]
MSIGEASRGSRSFKFLNEGSVDVTSFAKQVGIKLPVVITKNLWNEMVKTDENARMYGQKEEKRLESLLSTLRMELLKGKAKDLSFTFFICKDPKTTSCRLLKACYKDKDNGERYLRICTYNEGS